MREASPKNASEVEGYGKLISLCSEHFTEEVTTSLVSQIGITRKRRLVAGTVPTVFSRTTAPIATTSAEHGDIPEAATASSSRKRPAATTSGTASKRTRSAVEKRQRSRVSRSPKFTA